MVGEARLLTLIGPGGCGKSRLALEVAAASSARFQDGIFLVELASIGESRLVLRALADVLAVPDLPGQVLAAALTTHLRPKQMLLVLDNCEHVVAEVASITDALVRACPRLHILATSRVSLAILGERTWTVPPMNSADAVALLAERASETSAAVVDDRSAVLARDLCLHLDGMPLAIELAAARLKTLSLEQVSARLTDRFRLLSGSSRSAMPHHKSLQAAMDWSYELLTVPARLLWSRASVFAGGFELEAAEAVCSGGEMTQDQVVDSLTELVDNSILQVQEEVGQRRFHMLETVREYGLLKLDEAGERASFRQRHLDWCVELARRAEPEWRGPDQRLWLDRLGAELDNFRSALELACEDENLTGAGLELAASLWLFWHQHHIGEGRQWLGRLLERAPPDRRRAYALNVGGFMAYVQGEPAAALPLLKESLELNRRLGDQAGANFSLLRLGIGLYYNNELDQAIKVLREALHLYREANDRVGIYVSAYELAETLTVSGDYAAARTLHQESLALKELQGDSWHLAFSHFGIGLLAWMKGDREQAVGQLRESLAIRSRLDEWWGLAKGIEAQGWVEVTFGHTIRGLQLLGASEALHQGMGVVLSPNYRALHDRSLQQASRQLTADEVSSAWDRGRALTWSDAVAYALRDGTPAGPRRKRSDRVTRRELEVAGLVAAGMTNRAIARQLSLAERTIDAHVEHIMNKLGFRSRAQIAAWVTVGGKAVGES
jgi:non-specific serine/threonine protein kinase